MNGVCVCACAWVRVCVDEIVWVLLYQNKIGQPTNTSSAQQITYTAFLY